MSVGFIHLAVLGKIYEMIPPSKCKGLCQAFCGPQYMTQTEWEAIPINLRHPRIGYEQSIMECGAREDAFHKQKPIPEPACSYLDSTGKCSIYQYRPFTCRTWGANHLPMNACPFGCEETIDNELWAYLMGLWIELAKMDGSVEELDPEIARQRLEEIGRVHQ